MTPAEQLTELLLDWANRHDDGLADAKDFFADLKAAGFAIVPREPTNSMGDAGETALIFAKTGPLTGDEIGFPSFTWRAGVLAFRAMLAAYEREGNTDG